MIHNRSYSSSFWVSRSSSASKWQGEQSFNNQSGQWNSNWESLPERQCVWQWKRVTSLTQERRNFTAFQALFFFFSFWFPFNQSHCMYIAPEFCFHVFEDFVVGFLGDRHGCQMCFMFLCCFCLFDSLNNKHL